LNDVFVPERAAPALGSRGTSSRLVELQMVQPGIHAVELQQLLLRAVLYHHTVLDDDDFVCIAQGAQTMGDRDDRAARHQSFQGLDDQMLRLGIQGRRRLVENEDRVVPDQRTSDPNALALTAGECRTAVAHQAGIAVGHARDELVGVGEFGRLNDFVVSGIGPAESDVVADGSPQQHRVLQHEPDLGAESV